MADAIASPTPPTASPAKVEPISPAATVDPAAASAPVGGDDSALEASFAPKADKAAVKPADKPVEKAPDKPVDKEAPKADAKLEAKPSAEKPAETPVEKPEPGEHFSSNKEAREAAARRQKTIIAKDGEIGKLTTELTTLRAKVEEFSKNGGGDIKAVMERLAAEEKRANDLQTRLSEYDYRNSKEYEQQFTPKWNRAAQQAIGIVSKLPVTVLDAEGNETQQPGTAAHLERLLQMDPVAALDQAEAWFGKRAPLVMQHYAQLKGLQEESEAAIATHKATHGEKTKAQQAEQVRQSEFAREAYGKFTEDLMANRADLFKPAAEDAEHAEVINKAISAVDGGIAARADMPLDKRVKFDALLRTHAVSSLVQEHLLTKRDATIKTHLERITALEDEIKTLRGSGPGPSRREGDADPVKDPADMVGGDDAALAKAFGG